MMTKLTLLMTISWLPSLSAFTSPKTFFDDTSLHLSNSAVERRNHALFSMASTSEFSQDQDDAAEDIEDSFLVDNANCTSKFLRGLWELIARGNNMVRGVSDDGDICSTFLVIGCHELLLTSFCTFLLLLGIRNSSISRHGIPIHSSVSKSCDSAS